MILTWDYLVLDMLMSHINQGHSLFFGLNFLVFLSQDKTRVVPVTVCVCLCVSLVGPFSKKPATLNQLTIVPLLLYLKVLLEQGGRGKAL